MGIMKAIRRFFQTALSVVILSTLLLAFQNCQGLKFIDLNSLSGHSSSPSGSTDHGQGYGGKPTVTFYANASDVSFSAAIYLAGGVAYKIDPALPVGLTIDSSSGLISGTPTVNTADYQMYTIAATTASGSQLQLQILLGVGLVYTVDASVDGLGLPDANLADHLCLDANGVCSLQAALDQAAANTVKTRIILPNKSYLIGSAPIDSGASFELVGAGQGNTILDGQNLKRVAKLSGSDVSLKNLSVVRGIVADPDYGGGISFSNLQGRLQLDSVEISFSTASTAMMGGGGLFFTGKSLLINNSHIHDNVGPAGGASSGGGGIYIDEGVVLIQNSLVENNTSGYGGAGFYTRNATSIDFDHVTFLKNIAQYEGGAINNSYGQSMTVSQSTFTDNQSIHSEGGAIYIEPRAAVNLVIQSSSFSNNQAQKGGAISTGLYACPIISNSLQLHQLTFSNNISVVANGGGAISVPDKCHADIDNSIINANGSNSCSLTGILTSHGGNTDVLKDCGLNDPTDH